MIRAALFWTAVTVFVVWLMVMGELCCGAVFGG